MHDKHGALHAHSHGRVTRPDSYNYRTFLPERGGLFCTEIFGPVSWSAGSMAEAAGDDRAERFGHIELPISVVFGGAPRTVIVVVPPVVRRFRRMTAEAYRADGHARRRALLERRESADDLERERIDRRLRDDGLQSEEEINAREGEALIEPALNTRYRDVVNHANRLTRLTELEAPAEVIAQSRSALSDACARLEEELRLTPMPADIMAVALGELLEATR
jgi:hypothetical protein